MNRFFLFSFFLFLFGQQLVAQDGYQIKVKIDGFQEKEAYLGYHLLDKQYIRDTVQINDKGELVFEGSNELAGGVYLLIMPPENQYFPLLISEGEQHFTMETKLDDPFANMNIKGSEDNKMYYKYMEYLSQKVPQKNKLFEEIKAAGSDEAKKSTIKKQLETLDEEVRLYHKNLVDKFPKAFTSLLAKSRIEIEEPQFKGDDQKKQMQRYYFFKEHWFDNYSLDDNRMLRSPDLFKRVDYYMEKLTPQVPDSISISLDKVLGLMSGSPETYKYYLGHYLNKYIKSKVVGMDAIYVHLVENYYSDPAKTDWVEDEQRGKMVDNAKTLKPILIGKKAPDIKMKKRDESEISLHEVNSKYTVLVFWEPDCGHCKKTMPSLKDFYAKFKPQGVEVFGVCTKKYDKETKLEEVEKCWQFLDENEMNDWINTIDPFLRSRYYQKYDVTSTPRIFILDENKEILVKGIGKEQLEEVMDQIIKIEQEKMDKEKGRK